MDHEHVSVRWLSFIDRLNREVAHREETMPEIYPEHLVTYIESAATITQTARGIRKDGPASRDETAGTPLSRAVGKQRTLHWIPRMRT
jgi:hypothetical protein